MLTHVEVRSEAFPWDDSHSDDVHAGSIAFARYIAEKLRDKEFENSGPLDEDWGWYIELKNPVFRLWLGCGGAGREMDYLCFIEPHKPTIRRFGFMWRIDVSERVGAVQRAVDEILAEHSGVTERKWWTCDEYNRPPKKK